MARLRSQPKVRAASLPAPLPVIAPVAAITEHITSGTIDIWMSRMKMSPMNLMLAAQGPATSPTRIPRTEAMRICTVIFLRYRICAASQVRVAGAPPAGRLGGDMHETIVSSQ